MQEQDSSVLTKKEILKQRLAGKSCMTCRYCRSFEREPACMPDPEDSWYKKRKATFV